MVISGIDSSQPLSLAGRVCWCKNNRTLTIRECGDSEEVGHDRTDAISHDLEMQFRAILGFGLLSDWSTTSNGDQERTVLSR